MISENDTGRKKILKKDSNNTKSTGSEWRDEAEWILRLLLMTAIRTLNGLDILDVIYLVNLFRIIDCNMAVIRM